MPTPLVRRREPSQIGPLAIVAFAAVLILLAAGGRAISDGHEIASKALPANWLGLVGEGRPPVEVGQRLIVVLKAPSLAERVSHAGGLVDEHTERQWTKQAVAKQKELISRLALQGIVIRPEFTYTRVLDGFAAPLDPRAVSLLERAPEVRGVYPVRATYPASESARFDRALRAASVSARPPGVVLPGYDGKGVTVALLDTGVDRQTPYLAKRLAPGVDIVTPGGTAGAQQNPDNGSEVERHGTETAGVIVGHGGPFGMHGIAPRATLVPVRVAGWQRDAQGTWAVYGRSDQLIAGLEAAVDPNADGDAHDAARVALVGVTEPYAAFADGPEARAVNGALKLDTLVVVPAGNDGAAGPVYGSISGPAGAGNALAVGAADLRPGTYDVRVALRTGLEVQMSRVLPLAGAIPPSGTVSLRVAAPAPVQLSPAERAAGIVPAPSLTDFFGPDGTSRVAGSVALVRGGTDAEAAVENAARAGAYAILLYGAGLPAGALGLDENVTVPVIVIPEDVAGHVLRELGQRPVTATLGRVTTGRNVSSGRVAAFSSRGLAFDGRVKPDLVGPGVSIPTSEPGTHDDGSARFGTVNGSSVAAAAIAGTAVLLAQARPELGAAALKGVLTGAARPIPGEHVSAQGAGLVNVGAAAAAEVSVEPATLSLAPARVGRLLARVLEVRSVSGRPLVVSVLAGPPQKGLSLEVSPQRLRLAPGATAEVKVTARGLQEGAFQGSLSLVPRGGVPVRVAWLWSSAPRVRLLSNVCLTPGGTQPGATCPEGVPVIIPSYTAPAVLSLRAGQVTSTGGLRQVRPVGRLEIGLRRIEGHKELGSLVELRDLLPGQYAFGLTGRGPAGQSLVPGRYRLAVRAVPPGPGRATLVTLRFVIRR